MTIFLLRTDIRSTPGSTIELVFAVDNQTIRVSLDWATVEYAMGGGVADVDAVRDYLWTNRAALEIAVVAHLYARGIPYDHHVVMSTADLADAGLTPAISGPATTTRARTGADDRR